MDLLQHLNEVQAEAAAQTDGALLLLAGAGSGKTRVITYRVAHLLENGVSPFSILAITFTNKAAREMKERIGKLEPRGGQVWVSTFHAMCMRMLRRDADKIGYGGTFTIYDSDDSEKLMKGIMRDMNVNEKQLPPKAALGEISRAKDELIGPEDFLASAGGDFRLTTIAGLYNAYQKRLRQLNGMDFDDIIVNTVKLFHERPDVLDSYQSRFKYIMVDEYQDTNTAQYELIRLLCAKHGNLCVVGDDDQSIYGWRGANIRNILEFERDFKNAQVIRLEQNYRSTSVILDAANAVISNNKSRKGKTLWTDKPGGDKIRYFKAQSDYEEGAYIAENIQQAVNAGGRYMDHAVLYRANSQSRIIEEQFVRRNIPYRIFGGTRFYERREIRDVLAYLKALINPFDEVSLMRIINVPRRGIGDATLERITEYARESETPLINAMREVTNYMPPSKSKRVQEFAELFGLLQEDAQTCSPAEMIEKVLSRTGYALALKAETEDDGQDRARNVEELVSKAAEFEKNAEDKSLAAFLEEVALVADVDGYVEGADTAVLMTMHSAKGLEFKTVFLPGFEEGLFPSYRAAMYGTEREVEEERRLCYVGITRAMERLYIISAASRLQHGQIVSNAPSRFVKEIPFTLFEGYHVKPPRTADAPPISPRRAMPKEQREQPYKTAAPLPAPANCEPPDYNVGDKVRQMKYGVGTVTDINNAGADYEITVEFPAVGAKKFMAHLSKLAKVE